MDSLKHIWTILCSNSSVDSETKNVSLFNVIEQMKLAKIGGTNKKLDPETKIVNFNFELVSLLKKNVTSKIDVEEVIEFIAPGGKKLNSMTNTFEIPKEAKRFRRIMKIQSLNITIAGDYTFLLKIREKGQQNFEVFAEIPLQIDFEQKIN